MPNGMAALNERTLSVSIELIIVFEANKNSSLLWLETKSDTALSISVERMFPRSWKTNSWHAIILLVPVS